MQPTERRRATPRQEALCRGIRAVMEAQGRRYLWLSEQLGVPESTLAHYLRGTRTMPADFPSRVARILDMPEALLYVGLELSERCEKCRSGKDGDEEEGAA